MDIATIIGLLVGFGCLGMAIIQGIGIGPFIHAPSFLIVLGGATAATLMNYPLSEVLAMGKIGMKTFIASDFDPAAAVPQMVAYAENSRRAGLLSLEDSIDDIEDDFVRLGMRMIIDGTDADEVRGVLETELEYIAQRHKRAQAIFNAMAKYSPGFGMIGTLIGLISMLKNMDDPSSIGPAMAVALITTFYGAVLANLVFMPIAGKLKTRTEDESLMRSMIIEAIVMIQAQANPRLISQKMLAHLPPKLRDAAQKEEKPQAKKQGEETVGEEATSTA